MPVERQRLIFFAYFYSRSYRDFVLEASRNLTCSAFRPESMLKVWEDGFLQFTASKTGPCKRLDLPPMETVVDATTSEEQGFYDLTDLPAEKLLILFAQLVESGKDWRIKKDGRDRSDGWSNPCIELLTTRLKTGRWTKSEKIPELQRLIEAEVDDTSMFVATCIAHELWGTHLWEVRITVLVDTVIGRGMTVDTKQRVDKVLLKLQAMRPRRELMAAFAEPAPFALNYPNKRVLHFSTPLLRVLPIGPVVSGSPEHCRLMKFAPLLKTLSELNDHYPSHAMCLDNVEWSMEVYRLSVETMHCRLRDKRGVDHLSCNRPHLRVPVNWRRCYNKMDIECIEDLVVH